MNSTKKDTFIFYGLGFPIQLVNAPMKKRLGDWTIDNDFDMLQKEAIKHLAKKTTPLSGDEIGFIIDFLKISTRNFAESLGVTHPAVAKWIKEETKMNPCTEICLKLNLLNHLNVKDVEFREIYAKIIPKNLENSIKTDELLTIDGGACLGKFTLL